METGLEPVTLRIKTECSTIELLHFMYKSMKNRNETKPQTWYNKYKLFSNNHKINIPLP